MNAKTDS